MLGENRFIFKNGGEYPEQCKILDAAKTEAQLSAGSKILLTDKERLQKAKAETEKYLEDIMASYDEDYVYNRDGFKGNFEFMKKQLGNEAVTAFLDHQDDDDLREDAADELDLDDDITKEDLIAAILDKAFTVLNDKAKATVRESYDEKIRKLTVDIKASKIEKDSVIQKTLEAECDAIKASNIAAAQEADSRAEDSRIANLPAKERQTELGQAFQNGDVDVIMSLAGPGGEGWVDNQMAVRAIYALAKEQKKSPWTLATDLGIDLAAITKSKDVRRQPFDPFDHPVGHSAMLSVDTSNMNTIDITDLDTL